MVPCQGVNGFAEMANPIQTEHFAESGMLAPDLLHRASQYACHDLCASASLRKTKIDALLAQQSHPSSE